MEPNRHMPPLLAQRFLNWFLRNDLAEEVQGDLEEQFYAMLENNSLFKAKINYWYQVFNYLRPFALSKSYRANHFTMFQSYYKIAWRNLLQHKAYSLINVFGLTVGIAVFIITSLYIYNEFTFDTFHKDADRIYRIVNNRSNSQGDEQRIASTSFQIGEQAMNSVSGVKDMMRLFNFGRSQVAPETDETNAYYEDLWFANESFLRSFDFEFIFGNPDQALTKPNTVVITKEMAMKLFGSADVVGRRLLSDRDSLAFTVTGVLRNFPANSHISLNIMYSESSLDNPDTKRFLKEDWSSNYFTTYLLLNDQTKSQQVSQVLNKLIEEHQEVDGMDLGYVWLQPLTDIHFNSAKIDQGFGAGGNRTYVMILLFASLFVLIIACVNYMNLTTARFSTRAREMGIRKVVGAGRGSLIAQLITESMLISVISFLFAIVLVKLALPYFNAFVGKELVLDLSTELRVWTGLTLSMILIGFLAGIYPALFQSRYSIEQSLRKAISFGQSTFSVRKVLVVFQFTLSIIMIASTIVMFAQMNYIRSQELGFNKEQLLVVDINSGLVRRGADVIKHKFSQLSSISSVAISSRVPGEWKGIPKVKAMNRGEIEAMANDMFFIGVDEDFFSTFEIALEDEAGVMDAFVRDSTSVILNESAAKLLGINRAENQLLSIPSVDFYGSVDVFEEPVTSRVMGIVKDFNFQSLHQEIGPLVISPANNPIHRIDYIIARFNTENLSSTLEQMEEIVHSVDPAHLFEYNFLDKKWEAFYREDERKQSVFMVIAILTIIIACLGLLGLTTFMVQQRVKEIGIRKVLGADIPSLLVLVSHGFIKLIIVAVLVSIPITWVFLQKWLQDFAYKVEVSWWMFAMAGILALSVAVVTISFQVFRVAYINPVDSLRSE